MHTCNWVGGLARVWLVCCRKQVKVLGGFFTGSFCWSLFKWMFSGFGDSCGFDSFPSLGFRAKFWT